jgi:hypothetical protein
LHILPFFSIFFICCPRIGDGTAPENSSLTATFKW